MKKTLSCLLFLLACLSACRKKDLPSGDPGPGTGNNDTKGSIGIRLSNVVGDKPVVTGETRNYLLPDGDTLYTITTYNYYISNIVFVDDSGRRFAEPESYHLAMAATPSTLSFDIANVPKANYVSMEFLIGVDSVRNISGAQTGDLDTKYGMFWDWSTGYIMAKMEGTAARSAAAGNMVSYHIAGYKGPYSGIRKVTLPLTGGAMVSAAHTPEIHLQSDLKTWFYAFAFKGFDKMPAIGSAGAASAAIADNYSGMFSVTEIH
jgi:hypothetical protein